MRDLSYNGWKNYETWAVNAHLTNDEALLERLLSIVQNPDLLTQQSDALADWLRIDRDAEPEDVTIDGALVGMYMDLIASAFDNVDWRSIIINNKHAADAFKGYGRRIF